MGNKYVIFVDEDLVSGSAQLASMNMMSTAVVESGESDKLSVTSVASSLESRRIVLSSLAAALSGQATLDSGIKAFGGSDVATAMTEMSDGARSYAAVSSTEVLEGVSALVVDDSEVDIASLAGVQGLTIYPNIELRLPTPVETNAVAGPLNDWHLRNIGLASGMAGGAGILVGILDTGIDAAHPEFAGKTVHFAEFDAVGRLISTTPRDAGDHGTHVSSIATGALCGVAPDADLAVAAVLTNRNFDGNMSGTLVQIVNGFNWLVTHRFRGAQPGVDVVNASLGGAGFNIYLRSAVQTALQVGVPLIAAIGNNGRGGAGRHGSPGNYPETLGVGATDQSDVVAVFSDWAGAGPPTGPTYPVPNLCAPGVQVNAAKPGGGFQSMSGTSMATPVVTGVAARRMASNAALVGKPAALFADLRSGLASYQPNPLGNLGGAGRIQA